jgi:hypothetical protein
MESNAFFLEGCIADSVRVPLSTPRGWQMDFHNNIINNFQSTGGFQSDDFVPLDFKELEFQQPCLQPHFLHDQEPYYSSLSASSEGSSIEVTPETSQIRSSQKSAWTSELHNAVKTSTASISTPRLAHSSRAKARARYAPNILRAQQTQRGPIPATRPERAVDPKSGDEILSFSYSRQTVVMIFVVKYPFQGVDTQTLPEDFLRTNCVYPRAMAPPHEYSGKRGKYECDCNIIGWTLAWFNPKIRGHRGIIQRAVDSWRNTRPDKTMRSRKARREEKESKRVFQEKLVSV